MKVAARTTKIQHYASYMIGGEEVYGIAQLVPGGYVFTADGSHEHRLVSYKDVDLLLYGQVDIAHQQWVIDAAQGARTSDATYTTPDGLVLQGTAQWIAREQAWLFIDAATDHAYLTQRTHALVLGGRVDILEAQREADGNLAARVCGY
jgi:hypothetical protein